MDVVFGLAGALLFGVALLFLLGLVFRWLWNTTLPDIVGVKTITVVQAIKLMFLASLLFGGHRVVTVEQPVVTGPAIERAALAR